MTTQGSTANGVKEVALTTQPKAKRRSALAGVKELAARLESKRGELEKAQRALDAASATHDSLCAQVHALNEAYDLVKPQPRTRKGK